MTDTHVGPEPILSDALLAKVSHDSHGAQTLFLGVVRNLNDGRSVAAVTYDGFAPLAKKVLAEIAREAVQQWGGRVAAAHRTGTLKVGETSLAVAAATPHREEAYAACRYVVEEVKKRLPVWKKEHYADGSGDWLKGCSLDHEEEALPVQGQ